MADAREELAALAISHIIDILAGKCSITEEQVASHESDPATGQLLTGLLYLHQDLKLRESQLVDVKELRAALDHLAQKNSEIEQSRAEIAALAAQLSTPIIKVWTGTLMMPLIGKIDAQRARAIQATLLPAVAESDVRHVIVDLTGVSTIEESTADHIIALLQAVSLLGSEGILAGVTAQVARSFVDLGADLSRLKTVRDVETALRYCMSRAGQVEERG